MKLNLYFKYLLLGFACLASCRLKPKNEAKQHAAKVTVKPFEQNSDHQVVDLVMKLDEIKRKSTEVEKDSKGKRHLSGYVETPPTEKDPNYWVKVAEDNGGSYVAYYTFAVDRKSHAIKYYDVTQDSLISIDEWRKTTPADER